MDTVEERPGSQLSLRLLGGWSAELRPGSALVLPGRKIQALLAYLALHAGRPQPRAKLTALLWGDHNERLAGQSLRTALYLIKRALGPHAGEILQVDGDAVALRAPWVEVDAAEFARLAAEGGAASLQRAVALYGGELLEGLEVESARFEDWLRPERERLYELAIESFGKLLAREIREGRDEAAVQTAVRLLGLEPAEEAVHRTLMRLYDRLGRRAAALRQYQLCVGVLRRELSSEPEAETTELYLDILQGRAAEPVGARVAPVRAAAARRGQRPAASATAEVPLVGRAAEVRSLLAALESAQGGAGCLVVIAGEAGIGKTHLLAELPRVARQRGCRVLTGHCYQTEQVLPFRPFIEALRQGGIARETDALASLSSQASAELARLFPELSGTGPSSPTTPESRGALFEAICDLLGRMGGRQPLVLALEDIHWADEMTLRLLAFAARRLATRRVLLVATLREEDVEEAPGLGQVLSELAREPSVRRLALEALSAAETRELVAVLGQVPGDEERTAERAARVWQASRGNPLVVVETLREILDHVGPGAGEDPPVPVRVRELIEARLARLAEPVRQIVGVAAVAGEPVDFELLTRAGGMSERDTAEAVERLIRRRILQSAGERFEFSHERVRHVAYETLLVARRRALHRAVGEALEARHAGGSGEADDRLAHHFVQARLANPAVTYLARFAETARRRHALDEALRSLDQALGLVGELPEPERDGRHLELLMQKAFVLANLIRYREVFDLLAPHRARVEALGDPQIAGPYFFRLGMACMQRGDRDQAGELAQRALEEGSRGGDLATVGMARYLLSLRCYWVGRDFAEGAAHARQAIELLERVGEAHYRGWAYYVLACHLLHLGDFEGAMEAAAQPEIIAERLGEPRLRRMGCLQGLICATLGDWEAGVRHCERTLERGADSLLGGATLCFLGFAYSQGGDSTRAVAALEEGVQAIRDLGIRWTEARFLSFLADAYLFKGDVELARESATRAHALAVETDYAWGVAWAERSLGRALLAAGDLDPAEPHLRAARARFEAVGGRFEVARTSFHLAELLHRAGRAEECRDALAAAREDFRALGAPRWEARAAALELQLAGAPA